MNDRLPPPTASNRPRRRVLVLAGVAALGFVLAVVVLTAIADNDDDIALRRRDARENNGRSTATDDSGTSSSTGTGSPADPTGSTDGGPGPTGTTAGTGSTTSAGVRPLGVLTSAGPGETCLAGADDCLAFDVDCPELQKAASGEIDVRRATGSSRGVVMFFTYAAGTNWWLDNNPGGDEFLDDLRADGFTIVQVRWKRGSWLLSAPGEDAGTARVACRPATVVKWVHDNIYVPLNVDQPALRCGFCITGNSGGASQVSYALAFYGLDSILDAVIPTGGPPHSALAKGCLRAPGEAAYYYSDESVLAHIDGSYGFRNGTDGPCARHDAGWVDRWRADSVDTGGNDYFHPATRVHFIFGGRDDTGAPIHANEYVAALRAADSPHVSVETIPEMAHGFSRLGFPSLAAALLE